MTRTFAIYRPGAPDGAPTADGVQFPDGAVLVRERGTAGPTTPWAGTTTEWADLGELFIAYKGARIVWDDTVNLDSIRLAAHQLIDLPDRYGDARTVKALQDGRRLGSAILTEVARAGAKVTVHT